MSESEKPVEGVEADRERAEARDQRLAVQGEDPLTKFARVWESA